MENNDIKKRALEIAKFAEEKKAQDITVLGVSELTTIAEYFIIVSGQNEIQVKAIAREIEDSMAELGIEPYRKAGRNQGRWILLDYKEIIVHVFHQQERQYYELERLWADAEKILEEVQ
ncbi:MAG: ribosome silencing factor [Bacillota bacterium]